MLAPNAAGRVEPGRARHVTWAHYVARLLGACEVGIGTAGLLFAVWLVVGNFISTASQGAASDGGHPRDSWGWVFAIFLAPPAGAVLLAGVALMRRWRGRWWLQLLPLVPSLWAWQIVMGGLTG